jgi:O-Antigen ligase
MQTSFDSRAIYPGSARFPEWTLPVLLGLAAGVAAALFVTAHWTVAVAGAIIVLALSAVGCELFLFAVIFLLPLGWTLGPGSPVGDVATAARFATVGGFFLGSFWRGELDIRRLWEPRLTRASFLFGGAVLGSVIFGTNGITRDSVHAFYRLVSYIGFYLFLLAWVDSKRRLKRVAGVLLGSVLLIALYGMVQLLVGGYTSLWLYLNPPGPGFTHWNGRIPSLLNYPNSLAGYLNLVLPFALACSILRAGKIFKKYGRVSLGLGFAALLLSQSVGGLVAFGCVGALAGFWILRGFAARSAWLGGFAVLSIGFYVARDLLNPVHSAGIMGYDVGTRLLLWTTAWHFFVHSPLWGIGWGNFVGAYGGYLNLSWMQSGVYEVHNIYLQLLSETGVVGFVAFFALIFVALREARRQMNSASDHFEVALAFGCLGAIVTVLIHGTVDFLFEVSPPFGTVFWVLLALLAVNGRFQKGTRARDALTGGGNVVAKGPNTCA